MAAHGPQESPDVGTPPRGGLWPRTDPRARLLATLTVSAVLLAAARWPVFVVGFSALAALHLSSATPARAALAALRPFRFLLVFTLVVQAAFTPGRPLLPGVLPGFLTVEGAQAAAAALLRLGGVIAASAHLVATTSPLELARSLGWAIAPAARLGAPVREITLVMALGFHFFPVLLDESRQVRGALESRGVSLRHRSLRLRARALLVWTLAVLFGMVERSARLATALEARGFALPRAPRHRFPAWRGESTVVLAACLALAACAIGLR
jgi:energy-coupling factor transport system permease protein